MAICPTCGREEAPFGGRKCGYCAGRELGEAFHRGGEPEVERTARQMRGESNSGGSGCLLVLFSGGAIMAAMEVVQRLA